MSMRESSGMSPAGEKAKSAMPTCSCGRPVVTVWAGSMARAPGARKGGVDGGMEGSSTRGDGGTILGARPVAAG